MKLALINTPYQHVYVKMSSGKNSNFPLGLGYIASYVRQFGHKVQLFDPEAAGYSFESLYDKLDKFKPDLIGIHSVSMNYPLVKQIANGIRDNGYKGVVIYGGVHASAMPKVILDEVQAIDVVAVGEGEFTTRELLDALADKSEDWSAINGIYYRRGDEILRTPRRSFEDDVDQFPFPARDLVNLDNYRLHAHYSRGLKSVTMLSSRGCPSACTFCANLLTMGRRFRVHSIDYFIKEIKHLKEQYNIEVFQFVDDLFMADIDRCKAICRRMIAEKLNIRWLIFGRVDSLDYESIKLMKEAGCYFILFGMESGNNEILKKIGKNTTKDQARKAIAICNEVGIQSFNSFIIGNTGETHETAMDTVNFARELPSTFASFNIMVPFVGTPLFKHFYSDSMGKIDNWQNWGLMSEDFSVQPLHTELSNKELRQYIVKGYRKFYFRPSQIWRVIKSIESFAHFMVFLKGFVGMLQQVFLWSGKKEN
ncbi:MAG: radical SAM protein [Magnetococcales bacterium]|nr:radical SAM protein [Magnetococcales bacterium]